MQLGMVGLGRMGANMVRRFQSGGHQCVVFDRSSEAVSALISENTLGARSPAPVLSAALYQRVTSRGEADYQSRLLSAMRWRFGGHVEKSAAK